MRRKCAYCKRVIGEKCGRCGSLDVRCTFTLGEYKQWKCLAPGCGETWDSASERETTGVCDRCFGIHILGVTADGKPVASHTI
jgi:hypothetical protein